MDAPPADRPAFHDGRHAHQGCVADALARAEDVCRQRGARLTPLRRRVLELVWDSHRAVKAYDLLAALGETAGAAKPPTVYRTLEFLMEHGLVHRIDSLNAFVGCPQPGEGHSAQFLICGDCGEVSEMNAASIDRAVADRAADSGFALSRAIIELHGKCSQCATPPQSG
ncbi:MAG: transcriptional repressor [Rhodospirillales bacterium]|nr:transcriptional repressor [Rhodospirillales bacterium]MDE0377739.1 transcriptional repressor [Rhodospirillales bacterium]